MLDVLALIAALMSFAFAVACFGYTLSLSRKAEEYGREARSAQRRAEAALRKIKELSSGQ